MSLFPTPVDRSMEALPLDNPLRQMYHEDIYLNGGYHPSPFGRTKYWIIGPEDGQKVVFVHGITVPSLVFKDVAETLASNGFRVLLYDMYGRGYSEAPKLPCDPNLSIIQLALLLQYIGWDAVDTIVGFSMGGGVAAAFSATFPHLVRKNVVLMASVGLIQLGNARPQEALLKKKQPPSGEWALKLRLLQTEHLPGFDRIFESSGREGLPDKLHLAYETLGKSDKRFLIIHGTEDNLVPYNEAYKIQSYIPHAKLVIIEGGTHFLPMEDESKQKVTESLIAFMFEQ